MKLTDLNQNLADTNAELDRVRAEISALPSFQRGGRHHMDLSNDRQRLLRRQEELRALRQSMFQHN